MPEPGTPLRSLGFLTIGTFDPADPAAGHETTLRMVELGEQLGSDGAWFRHRHLQYGISSPVAVLAAATSPTCGPSPAAAGGGRAGEHLRRPGGVVEGSPTGCNRTPPG